MRSRLASTAYGAAVVFLLVGCTQPAASGSAATHAAPSAEPSSSAASAAASEEPSADATTAPADVLTSIHGVQAPREIGRWVLLETSLDEDAGLTYASPQDESMITILQSSESRWELLSEYALDDQRTESADGRLVCGIGAGDPTCFALFAGTMHTFLSLDPEVTLEDLTSFATTLVAAND